MLEVFSLPCSNADAERLFSHYSLIKRKHRNALKLETIKSLIHLKVCNKKYRKNGQFQSNIEMLLSIKK